MQRHSIKPGISGFAVNIMAIEVRQELLQKWKVESLLTYII